MKTFVEQVAERHPKAKWELTGERDGFGRYRSVTFRDRRASAWLEKVLPLMWDEPRLRAFTVKNGYVTVTFVADSRADFRHPFPFEAAETVLDTEAE